MIRIGNTGTVRLTGVHWKRLVLDVKNRDRWTCRECGRVAGALDPAHIKSRGAGGSDVAENLRLLCRDCHTRSHAGTLGTKPVPKKGA